MTAGKFNASPSKEFFVKMLTKDIPLERAIMDLIDNSIDGAKTQLVKENKSIEDGFTGYVIDISFDENKFEIKDNCGGFSKEAAENYVFKFGRPHENDNSNQINTVGRFGVGMKRGLFKIGNHFTVETKNESDHFMVEESVVDWQNEVGTWEFDFTDISNGDQYLNENGTKILVTELNPAVKQDFELTTFENFLKKEIKKTFNYSLKKGITINVNGTSLESNPIELLVNDALKPFYLKEVIEDVTVEIFAGIGEPNPNQAGWYIFCNDRLMVDRDTTNLTGWEGGQKFYDDSGVQKYHNKVSMFRGLVFFTSNESPKLPMTTTKWGIDVNSTLYKTVRAKMIEAMKQVLSELNRLDNAEQRSDIVSNSTSVDIMTDYPKESLTSSFLFPEIKKTSFEDDNARVSYRVNKELLLKVQKSVGTKTYGDTGLETFNYYVRMKKL